MFLIRRMSFSVFFVPYGGRDFGEKGVSLRCGAVYFRQAKFVGKGNRLLVDTCAADDIYVFILLATLQSRFE